MAKKYRPKIKGYVLPYIYRNNELLILVGMEKLKQAGEYYCTLLGGTCKSLRSIYDCTVRELCEETRGYLQIDKDLLKEYLHFTDKDRCTVFLLPLKNDIEITQNINAFKNGLDVDPKCAENSFIVAVNIDSLLSWKSNNAVSSDPFHYFKKAIVNKYPLQSYYKFLAQMSENNTKIWASPRLGTVLERLRLDELRVAWDSHGTTYQHQDREICKCLCMSKRSTT